MIIAPFIVRRRGCPLVRSRAGFHSACQTAIAVALIRSSAAITSSTSAGVALDARAAERLVKRLQAAGVAAAAMIGRATARRDAWVHLI